MNFKHLVKKFLNELFYKMASRRYKGRLTYYFKSNKSDTLIIVFSAFTPKPCYNYVKTLMGLKIDKLFILDDFGEKGSYYWYENGEDYPQKLTESLIASVVGGAKYRNIMMAGSSKGGTCAIFYGMKFHANHIFAGACQYLVGNYLYNEWNRMKFYGMMGHGADELNKQTLNEMVAKEIENEKGNSNIKVHLLFSDKEHTYEDDIIPLKIKLDECGIEYDESIWHFEDHSEVGKYFGPFLKSSLQKII